MTTHPDTRARAVLIVEDDAIIGRMLVHTLKRMKFEVEWVQDGFSAVDKLAEDKYAVVITDLSLPGCSGMEVAGVCRDRSPQTQVVIVSGDADDERIQQAIQAGAFYYLRKPFDHVKLVGLLVSRAAERYRLGQLLQAKAQA